jgi:integrase/recombinase XerC
MAIKALAVLKNRSPTRLSDEEKLSRLISSFMEGRKATTTEAYRRDLEEFRAFLELSSIEEIPSYLCNQTLGNANSIALEYRASLKERGFQSNTINRRLASLRSLIKFARTIGLITWSLEVKGEKTEAYRDTSGISPEIFQALLKTTSKQFSKLKAARDIATLRLMYDLGLRRAEVLGLDVEDIDFNTHEISILGKGRTQKEKLCLSPQSEQALNTWIQLSKKTSGAIFTDFDRAKKNPGRLTAIGLTLLVSALGKRLGVKLSPHKLRHSAITQACKLAQANNIDLEEVLDFSRHKNVQTLMIYRDRERNVQGTLASLVGATVS